jgi:hypothetical protein
MRESFLCLHSRIAFYRHTKTVVHYFYPRMRGACLRVSYDFADKMRQGKKQDVSWDRLGVVTIHV